jgi:hypothetical protein
MLPGQVITFQWNIQTDILPENKATKFPGHPSQIQFQVWLGRAQEFDPVPGVFINSPGPNQLTGSFDYDVSNKPFNSPFAMGQNIAVLTVWWPGEVQFQPTTGNTVLPPDLQSLGRTAVVTIRAKGVIIDGLRVSSLTFTNCSVAGDEMFVWVNDSTAVGGWQQRLTLASSYDPNSGGCGPGIAADSWQPETVSFQTGHTYQVRVIYPGAAGCGSNDFENISCIRWDSGVFHGDSSSGISQAITIST